MIAFNHALTGALIVAAGIHNPALALPAALASHYLLDAIPHFGSNGRAYDFMRSRRFAVMLLVDALLCLILVIVLATVRPEHWLLMSASAFVATVPDFAWLPGFVRAKTGQALKSPKQNWYMQFAKRLQWFEQPVGAVVEVAWAAGAITLLVAYL